MKRPGPEEAPRPYTQAGNARSWICNADTGWVQISFPAKARINRIIWSRERNAQLADRVAVSYRIKAVATPRSRRSTSSTAASSSSSQNSSPPA